MSRTSKKIFINFFIQVITWFHAPKFHGPKLYFVPINYKDFPDWLMMAVNIFEKSAYKIDGPCGIKTIGWSIITSYRSNMVH